MPGIYVRKASWIDWIQKGENTALTVPGSYWLCHKDDIYKFVFRYDRTSRNIKQFTHGRELMKVIRRIIKSQPPQGQQFGTSHLLVIFNRIAWTRQDKMFAMMQFKERSVTAYSHAFVLTIKLCQSLETEQSTGYAVTSPLSGESFHQDEDNSNEVHDCNASGKKGIKYVIHSNEDDTAIECSNIQEQVLHSGNTRVQLDQSVINDKLKTSVNKELVDQYEPINNLSVSFNLPVASEDTKLNKSIVEGDNNCLGAGSITQNKLSSNKYMMENTELSRERLNEYNIENNSAEYKNTCAPSDNRMSNDNNAFDDTNVDSINLPYQYLIEKEIENAKQNIKKRDLDQTNEEKCTKRLETNSDVTDIRDSSCSKRKKYAPDNVARSSDITDLVMEGLMFTIRQDQDTVAVIEQKTKLEVDEVLENSEKIETLKGEKCLRNSSLLGLENLITMIELPKESEHGNRYQPGMANHHTLRNQSMNKLLLNNIANDGMEVTNFVLKSCNNVPSANANLLSNNDGTVVRNNNHVSMQRYSIFDENVKNSEDNGLEYDDEEEEEVEEEIEEQEEGEKEEEEEDIVPEALQNEIFHSSSLSTEARNSEEQLNALPGKDLLMDDIENEDLLKFEKTKNDFNICINSSIGLSTYSKHNCSINSIAAKLDELSENPNANEMHNTTHQSSFTDTINSKSKSPVIISDQIITLNQIPLPLQKILKNRLSMRHIVVNNKCKTIKNDTDVHETETCKDNVTDVQLENQTSNNMSPSSKNLNLSQDCINKNIEAWIESANREQDRGICIEREEETSSNRTGIQDITQQFYRDMSHLQKKGISTNQKHLRSRRQLQNPLNSDNGEVHIQMVKFFQDITRGAKVVIRRMHINKYS